MMTVFRFADRYAEAGLAPTSQVIASRRAPADRIVAEITRGQVLDLTGVYFGSPEPDLDWFRDQFAAEDESFSLVNNERETRVLAAAILGALVADGQPDAILAVMAGYVVGHRVPPECDWLIGDAKSAMDEGSVAERKAVVAAPATAPVVTTKLADEIKAVGTNDWATLLDVLGKVRAEGIALEKASRARVGEELDRLNRQVRLLREEAQMLWWLFGGHSRALARSFGELGAHQAALVGAVDLGNLTTVTSLGPIAAPVMLERVIAMAKKPKGNAPRDLAGTIDGLAGADLERLRVHPDKVSPRLGPVTAAIELARTIGAGSWQTRFQALTGLDARMEFEPSDLAVQLYREQLLGQVP